MEPEQAITPSPPTISNEEREQVLAHYPEIQMLRKVTAMKKPTGLNKENKGRQREDPPAAEERVSRETTSATTLYPEFDKFRRSRIPNQ